MVLRSRGSTGNIHPKMSDMHDDGVPPTKLPAPSTGGPAVTDTEPDADVGDNEMGDGASASAGTSDLGSIGEQLDFYFGDTNYRCAMRPLVRNGIGGPWQTPWPCPPNPRPPPLVLGAVFSQLFSSFWILPSTAFVAICGQAGLLPTGPTGTVTPPRPGFWTVRRPCGCPGLAGLTGSSGARRMATGTSPLRSVR